ncbi:MAG: hypothetical protein AAFO80_01250 [Pseudomonadota bacterium]
MTAVQLLRPDHVPASHPEPRQDGARAVLNQLRLVALDCRTAARADLFEACALLSIDKATSGTAFAEALMKCLPQALGTRPRMLRPGVEELSFDEAWLNRLIEAAQHGDADSFAFLLRSRVRPEARRNVGYLIRSLALKVA